MGSNPDESGVTDRRSDAADRAGDTVRDAPEHLEQATRGNPIAAGLIAAGLGALAGSMMPSSKPERELGGKLREEFEQPARSELQHAGEEMREEPREDAQESAESIKATAQGSVERTRGEAEDSAQRVKNETQAARGGSEQGTPPASSPGRTPRQ